LTGARVEFQKGGGGLTMYQFLACGNPTAKQSSLLKNGKLYENNKVE